MIAPDAVAGATLDLAGIVRTHLFILCPNNSGSTFLMRAVGTSRRTWSLQAEGQNVLGFRGPSQVGEPYRLLHAARPETAAVFRDPGNYDWPANRRCWYFQATSRSADAPVLVVKSPTFLAVADQLARNFKDARFLFMVRNPYATIEGIVRARTGDFGAGRAALLELAARHVVETYKMQIRNIEDFPEIASFFTYEEMCADPVRTAAAIRRVVPVLDDLDLSAAVPVKGRYFEPLRDMNPDQIGRLTTSDIRLANRILEPQRDIVRALGYELIDA